MSDTTEPDRRDRNRRSGQDRRAADRRSGDDTRLLFIRFLLGDRRWQERRAEWDRRRRQGRRDREGVATR